MGASPASNMKIRLVPLEYRPVLLVHETCALLAEVSEDD